MLGKIAPIAGDKEEVAEEDKRHSNGSGEIYFWTDGSRLNSRVTRVSVAGCSLD